MEKLIFDNKYTLNDEGIIRRARDGKIMKPSKLSNGYYNINIYTNGVQKSYPMHHLVYTTFKGEVAKGSRIRNIDGNKDNYCLSNLELVVNKNKLSPTIVGKRQKVNRVEVSEAEFDKLLKSSFQLVKENKKAVAIVFNLIELTSRLINDETFKMSLNEEISMPTDIIRMMEYDFEYIKMLLLDVATAKQFQIVLV